MAARGNLVCWTVCRFNEPPFEIANQPSSFRLKQCVELLILRMSQRFTNGLRSPTPQSPTFNIHRPAESPAYKQKTGTDGLTGTRERIRCFLVPLRPFLLFFFWPFEEPALPLPYPEGSEEEPATTSSSGHLQ
ncbi:uncharacterized protein DSM5745_02629 [Aspergillus mulundensis]|uniref:Uncharacterized protein n=1 Tax=Aspergillus mulundensis TaxID=1810919 RepID=A0A3D8SX56_9EURO|nr:hypothetical protein DSM5745_02629 [Aspergillus mulundensis]RDW90854.1 hypothetical protein DSM5745_02629 [Aspergillus mulundensis]